MKSNDISLMHTLFNVLQTYHTEERDVYDPDSGTYDRVVINTLGTYNGFLRMETTETYIFTTGKLIVSFVGGRDTAYYNVSFAIKVGTLWYNPTTRQWQQTFSSNDMRINVGWGQKYEIPIGNMTGTVMLYIYD